MWRRYKLKTEVELLTQSSESQMILPFEHGVILMSDHPCFPNFGNWGWTWENLAYTCNLTHKYTRQIISFYSGIYDKNMSRFGNAKLSPECDSVLRQNWFIDYSLSNLKISSLLVFVLFQLVSADVRTTCGTSFLIRFFRGYESIQSRSYTPRRFFEVTNTGRWKLKSINHKFSCSGHSQHFVSPEIALEISHVWRHIKSPPPPFYTIYLVKPC